MIHKKDIIYCHIYKIFNKFGACHYVVAANIKEAIDIYESNCTDEIEKVETITTNALIVP